MMIPLEHLQSMFANMRAKTNWDVDEVLFWGYFFTASNPLSLEEVAAPLAQRGYQLVDIYKADDDRTCVLHVEMVERQNPESLHERNGELEALAAEFGLDSCDGMDVGLASG